MQLFVQLPFPPSANTYWRHPTTGRLAGRHLISEKGRAYRTAVIQHVQEQFGKLQPMDGAIKVDIEAFMPDKRRRDLDNLCKGSLDSLTHAGVWLDDSQICDLRIHKAPTIGGFLRVTITKVVHGA